MLERKEFVPETKDGFILISTWRETKEIHICFKKA